MRNYLGQKWAAHCFLIEGNKCEQASEYADIARETLHSNNPQSTC